MSWVIGIREVKMRAPERDLRETRKGPASVVPVRVIVDLPTCALGGTIKRGGTVFLPVHTGAGPCGTNARVTWGPRSPLPRATPLEWTVAHLLEPLRAYYAAYEPPMRFGAKSTPRGRRAE